MLIGISSIPCSCPPACNPRGPNTGPYVGHMSEQSITGKMGKQPWKGRSAVCLASSWDEKVGRELGRNQGKSCQHYLRLKNRGWYYRGICRMVIPGWMLKTTHGSIVVLSSETLGGYLSPHRKTTLYLWGAPQHQNHFFLPSNTSHIHPPGHITDFELAHMAKPCAYCRSLC